MDMWLDHIFFHHGCRILAIPWRRTAWALGRRATACVSKHILSAWWLTTSFFTCGPRSSGPTTWAIVNRSWWPNYLACTFSRFDLARLLPMGSHEILDLQDPCGIWGRPTARVMAVTDVGGPRIGDRVFQNMVWRYRICVSSVVVTSIKTAASPWRKYTPWPALCECCMRMLYIETDPSHPSVSAGRAWSIGNPFPHHCIHDVVHGGTVFHLFPIRILQHSHRIYWTRWRLLLYSTAHYYFSKANLWYSRYIIFSCFSYVKICEHDDEWKGSEFVSAIT